MIDEEDVFRGTGNAVAPPADENLAEDWDVLRGLPRYIYVVYPGYSCDDMELWRHHVIGQQRVKHGRVEDQWVYKHDRPLWQGPKVNVSRREIGKVYVTSKRHGYRTLAEALDRFCAAWNEHVERARLEVVRLNESIATYQRERDMYLATIKETEAGPRGVLIVAEIEDAK